MALLYHLTKAAANRYDYNISFFFSQYAITIDNPNEINIKTKNEAGSVLKSPSGTFIPIKDAIIVGIENTIVIPAKNFIKTFKLFEIILAYVSVVLDMISL